MRRKKVNCLCRCTPQGIESLSSDHVLHLYREQLSRIRKCENPGQIADMGIHAGQTLYATGHPRLALKLMHTALSRLISTDLEHQLEYLIEHGWPPRREYFQWYHPLSARVSDADAYRLASHIDRIQNAVNEHLGYEKRSNMRCRVRDRYDAEFFFMYEVSSWT